MRRSLIKIVALAALLMPLAACNTVSQVIGGISTGISNPVTPTTAKRLVDLYGVAQTVALAYLALPRCPGDTVAFTCAAHSWVAAIKAYDKIGAPAALELAAIAQNPANYPNLSIGTVYASLQSALSGLQSIETSISKAPSS